VNSAFPQVFRVDSRFRGNDCGQERPCLADDTTTQDRVMRFNALWVNALQRRFVSCKRTRVGSLPPHPAPSADGLVKAPARATLSPKGEGAGIGPLGLVVRRLKSVG